MRFKVDPAGARTERRRAARQEKLTRLTEWHFFFAILPRRIVHGTYNANTDTVENYYEEIAFLETIARRGLFNDIWTWHYGPVTRVLENK